MKYEYFRWNYHRNELTSDVLNAIEVIEASGLTAYLAGDRYDHQTENMQIPLYDYYAAVTAKTSPLLFALDTLEAKNNAYPSHIFQTFGGETRLYPRSYDTLVQPYVMDELGKYSNAFIIQTGDDPLKLPTLSKGQICLFWHIKDRNQCNDGRTFFRDIWDYNLE